AITTVTGRSRGVEQSQLGTSLHLLCCKQMSIHDRNRCGGAVMTKHTALIPLDGSPFSDQIVPHIRRLLDPEDYSLVLLRVAEPVAGLVGAPPRPVSIAWTAAMH